MFWSLVRPITRSVAVTTSLEGDGGAGAHDHRRALEAQIPEFDFLI
jgi:hypothetical protein